MEGQQSGRGADSSAMVGQSGGATQLPPPVAGPEVGVPPMPPATDRSTSKRPTIVFVVIGVVVVLLVAAGALMLVRGRGAGTDPTSQMPRLPTEPTELYTITLDDSVERVLWSAGSLDRVYVTVKADGQEQIRMFGSDGDELWRRDVEGTSIVETVGDSVVIGPMQSSTDGPLIALDVDTGDERWSTEMAPFDEAYVMGDKLVLRRNRVGEDTTVVVIDPENGEKIAERQFQHASPNLSTPTQDGALLVVEDDEVFLVDNRLEDVSAHVPAVHDIANPVGFMDDEIVVAKDGQLARLSSDGDELATADFEGGAPYVLAGVKNSTWLYLAANECGAVDFSGEQVEVLWNIDDCEPVELQQPLALSFSDGDGEDGDGNAAAEPSADDRFVLVTVGGSEQQVVNAMTGEVAISNDDDVLTPYANGVVALGQSEWTAYALPGGEEMWSVDPEGRFDVLDGGYAVVSSDERSVTVYG